LKNPSFIALDLGTSSIKGAVIDLDRLRLAHVQSVPFPAPIPGLPPLFCEIDPGQVVSAVGSLLERLLPHAPNCAGVVTCGQMGGLVLATGGGAPLSNCISWRDQRLLMMRPPASAPSGAGTYWDLFQQRLSPAERRQLGNELQPGNPLSLLFWLAQEKRLPGPGAIAATLPDFVLARLCGAAPGPELTLATSSINLETLDWHHAAFARLGLESVRWPALRGLREPVGRIAIGGSSLPCYAPVGDHACALAGAFIGEGELSLNISTGSQASLLTARLELGNYQTRPFFDGRFLNTITHIPAGRALNVLLGLAGELAAAQGVQLDDPWPVIQQAVAAVSETDLDVDLAFFPSPVGQRGAISNIREGNLTLGQLFYGAFRNMADNYAACARRLAPDRKWNTLVFSGGLAQKLERLREMILARFDCRYRLCASTEDTLIGLLALALVIDGRAPSVASAVETLRNYDRSLIEEQT
jgi:sugar (pentulose or hexulose) kinase